MSSKDNRSPARPDAPDGRHTAATVALQWLSIPCWGASCGAGAGVSCIAWLVAIAIVTDAAAVEPACE